MVIPIECLNGVLKISADAFESINRLFVLFISDRAIYVWSVRYALSLAVARTHNAFVDKVSTFSVMQADNWFKSSAT